MGKRSDALQAYCEKIGKCDNCPIYDDPKAKEIVDQHDGVCEFLMMPESDLKCLCEVVGLEKPVNDPVNRPSHYTDGKIEVIDYIEDKKFDFCLGNAIKYISRAGKKDKTKEVEDLEKAIYYINRRIKQIREAVV